MRNAFSIVIICLAMMSSACFSQDFRVGTIEREPFAFKVNDEWTGFSIELWQRIGEDLGVQTEYVEFQNFPDMLEAVKLGDVTIASANISVTAERESVLDFSQPIFDSGLAILAAKNQQPSLWSVIKNARLWSWIAGAYLLFLVAGVLIALFEKKHPHFEGRSRIGRLREGLWWSVSVVTNASFTIFTPVTVAGRLTSYALIIVGLFVVSAFVATITASLTVQELRTTVNGLNDLRDKKVGTTLGSTSSAYLTTQAIDHSTYATLSELFTALEDGKVSAIVHDAPLLAHYARIHGQGKYQIAGRIFKPEKYAIAMPQSSVQRERINRSLLRVRDSGEYDELIIKWFGAQY